MSLRAVKRIVKARPTIEGAGDHLHRGFGFDDPTEFDPFLLFDDFRNDQPSHYKAGFPWHPHRGIETITYVLTGEVEHKDSLGNTGTLGAGDVQWMTAGSGIIHQEMPQGDPSGKMHGFQLWTDRHEHRGRVAASLPGLPERHIHESLRKPDARTYHRRQSASQGRTRKREGVLLVYLRTVR